MELKLLSQTDMRICSFCAQDADETEFTQNRQAVEELACFSHKEAWEYIIYIPEDDDIRSEMLESLTGNYSAALAEAIQGSFNYICFYAG